MRKSLLIILLTMNIVSCNQVTKKYKTYELADQDGLFQRAWIPYDFLYQDMQDIFVRTNVDLNSCIFSFKSKHRPVPYINGLGIQRSKINVDGIDIPDWWNERIIGNRRINIRIDHSETVSLVIDTANEMIYGWRESRR